MPCFNIWLICWVWLCACAHDRLCNWKFCSRCKKPHWFPKNAVKGGELTCRGTIHCCTGCLSLPKEWKDAKKCYKSVTTLIYIHHLSLYTPFLFLSVTISIGKRLQEHFYLSVTMLSFIVMRWFYQFDCDACNAHCFIDFILIDHSAEIE